MYAFYVKLFGFLFHLHFIGFAATWFYEFRVLV